MCLLQVGVVGILGYVSPLPIRGSQIIGHYTLINYLTRTEINPDNFTRIKGIVTLAAPSVC